MTARTSPFGDRLRHLRQQRGLTQGALAALTGTSRQAIGAVETGRHLPRVDTAVALASALGVRVEDLLGDGDAAAIPMTGQLPDGQSVRATHVGSRLICVPVRNDGETWDTADGVVREDTVELFTDPGHRAIVAGCDPVIGLIDRLVREGTGPGLLPAVTTSAAAAAALVEGRTHAAVVHGPDRGFSEPPPGVRRFEVARWQVGLCAPPGMPSDWVAAALAGRSTVIQREPDAASQQAFVRAVTAAGGTVTDPGATATARTAAPRATGHLDAASWSRRSGLAGVTMEPAAAAFDLDFHPLEEHVAHLWVPAAHLEIPGIRSFLETLAGPAVRRRLATIGGYDLDRAGTEVAA